jgi:hypothetical protein
MHGGRWRGQATRRTSLGMLQQLVDYDTNIY